MTRNRCVTATVARNNRILQMSTLAFQRRETRPLPTRSWPDILKASDPLAAWKIEFEAWIEGIKAFRSEETRFLKNTNDEVFRRVHRGWICSLISEGERQAIELLDVDADDDEKSAQLRFLNTFLRNLQATLTTWHSVELDETANPLARFFA